MRKFVAILALLAPVICGCGKSQFTGHPTNNDSVVEMDYTRSNGIGSVEEQKVWFKNLEGVKTVGNMSYLPIDMRGRPSEHPELLMTICNKFEEAYPNLEVTSRRWDIERMRDSKLNVRINGIWLEHTPKKEDDVFGELGSDP